MRFALLLLLAPALAPAGVIYDRATRQVDQSDLTLPIAGAGAAPVVTHFAVADGKVRIDAANAKTVYLFEERTMFVIDNPTKTVHVLKHATLSQLAAHYAEAVRQLETAAAHAPPEQREEAARKAADMKEVSDRMRQVAPREFRVTVRFESVDGHACRIWEEREKDVKRLEVCVASPATVPGGNEILSGLKTLSQFREGSDFALGIDFGLSEWWPDFVTLGGVPLLIREYKYDSEVAEVMLSAMRQSAPDRLLFEPPAGYRVQEGPDYARWYVR